MKQLSLYATTIEPLLHSPEPQVLKPEHPRAHALQQEKPPQREACTPPLSKNRGQPMQQQRLSTAEINKETNTF